jgi:DNA-binding MarR family transcriptional regulator
MHDLGRSPVHLLHRAAQCAGEIFDAAMVAGITPRQLAVLVTVAEHEGLSQTDLTELTGIDRGTMADIVHRLIRKRLLQRRRSRTDARAYMLTLTDDGKEGLAEAMPLANGVDARILDALPKSRRQEFVRALRTVIGVLGKMAGQEGPR